MCDFYLCQCWMQTFRSWCYFSSFTVNSNVFSFSKLITLTAFSLKETHNLFIQSSPQYMLIFSIFNCTYSWHLISARKFLPIFVAADFSGLFLQLSVTFYSKIEDLHEFSAIKDRRQFKFKFLTLFLIMVEVNFYCKIMPAFFLLLWNH